MSAADTLQWVQIAAAGVAIFLYASDLGGLALVEGVSLTTLGFAMFTLATAAAFVSVAIDPSILTGRSTARR